MLQSKIENRLTFLAKNMTLQAAENPNGGLTHYGAEDLMHNSADDSGRECRSQMKLYSRVIANC